MHVEPKHTLDTLRGMLSSNKCSDNKTFINKMEARRRRRRRRKEEGGGGWRKRTRTLSELIVFGCSSPIEKLFDHTSNR